MKSIREKFAASFGAREISSPVYAVYDWFVKNRRHVAWEDFFARGLGQINHANLIRHETPHFEFQEELSVQDGQERRDVRLLTEIGELHEWYLGEWRQEYFIKDIEDYRIMKHALRDIKVYADEAPFQASETRLGDNGITLGQIQGIGSGRTPLMILQIDWVGLENFSVHMAEELPEMLSLMEVMEDLKLEEFRQAVKTPCPQIKLWENLSLETIGPYYYKRYLESIYRKIIPIMDGAGKKLLVHYDGKLRMAADIIAGLSIDGIDSLTEAPEGDLTVAQAREYWPEKYFWINPGLNRYRLPLPELKDHIRRMMREAGDRRYCLVISEEVPWDCGNTVPAVLETIME
ncbi:MAG: hypothetical protein PHV82_08165 [Victivallaceae bacterium]|nr:hypothetical protein [Victivallaceae bacterium]